MSLPNDLCAHLADRLAVVRAEVEAARVAAGRSDGVQLLAVSKTQSAQHVLAAVAAGQTAFGENYVQEGVNKILACRAAGVSDLSWHFIGPLQSNKSRLVAELFDWVESVDRLKIAERLSEQRPDHLPPLQVLVQVNTSGEASKSGCPPEAVNALCATIAQLPRVQLRGLMAIPEPAEGFAAQRAACAPLRELFDHIKLSGQVDTARFDTLSIGMSHDLAAAIAEGSTQVRIGTAIFGQRPGKSG